MPCSCTASPVPGLTPESTWEVSAKVPPQKEQVQEVHDMQKDRRQRQILHVQPHSPKFRLHLAQLPATEIGRSSMGMLTIS